MALKNHTIDSNKVAEEQIEAIIDGKIKYDPNNQSIILLPNARELSNDKKILLYLVALRGWSFIIEKNTPSEDASPAEITINTNIPGGSVRPILRTLEDQKIILVKNGRYQIPPHNLAIVASLLAGGKTRINRTDIDSAKNIKGNNKNYKKNKDRNNTKGNKPTLAEGFNNLISKNWFKEGKTTIQLKDKLDEMTIFPPVSQLPFHLLKAYRAGLLSRKKETLNDKRVWVYYQ